MKKFDFYQDQKHEWRWRLIDGNNKIVADSGEGYHNRADCQKGAALFTALGPDAPVRAKEENANNDAEWVYYTDRAGEWRWHFLVKGNADNLIADSAEGYDSKPNVLRAITNVKSLLKELGKDHGNGNGNGTTNGGGFSEPSKGGSNVKPRFA